MDGARVGELLLACLLLSVVVFLAFTFVRRRLIAGGAPMFLCSYRRDPAGPWRHGLARFDADALAVFALGGVSFEPRMSITRAGMEVLDAREPTRPDATPLIEDPVHVSLLDQGQAVDLVLPRELGTALRSWHEATPPGQPPRTA